MLTAAAAVFPAAAWAAAGPPPAHWLAKSSDLPRMATRSQFQWVSCGGPGGLPCQAGDVPTFTDYNVFYKWAPAHPGATVLYDPERWAATPAWQWEHMYRYLIRFDNRAHAYGIRVIAAPVRDTSELTSLEVTAAKYGAYAVDIQRQALTGQPARYGAWMKAAAAAIRVANPRTLVLAGIATDAGGRPVTVAQIVASYTAARAYVDGWWLNAAIWTAAKGGTGCAVTGCRAVGAAFLAEIGS